MGLVLLLGGCAGAPPKDDAPSDSAPPVPVVLEVQLAPSAPFAGDALYCSADTGDVPAVVAYSWTNTQGQSIDSAVVSEGVTVAGETWTCTAVPSNEAATGAPASASVSIAALPTPDPEDTGVPEANTPPTAPGVVILPETPREGDPIGCLVQVGALDADGDAVYYRYAWARNGVETADLGATVSPGVTVDDEEWTCTVTPFDGVDEGPPGEATVTIGACSGGALAFTGEDYVSTPSDPALDLGVSFTVEAWVKLDGTVSDDPMVVVSRWTDGVAGWWLGLVNDEAGDRHLTWAQQDGARLRTYGGLVVPSSRWVHVAATVDAGQLTLWVDGVPNPGSPVPEVVNAESPLRVGTLWVPGTDGVASSVDGGWTGLLDQVHIRSSAVYSAAFTPDIQGEAAASSLLYWEFGEGAGAVTADSGASGTHVGVLYGPTWTSDSPCSGGI